MGRKKVLEGGTRDEIIKAALALFMERGYEETSVRMILDESNAVVGSFYHYFKSKEELFDETIVLYLKNYEKSITSIAFDDTKTAMERITLLIDDLERWIRDFYSSSLHEKKFHWTMECALRQKTIEALIPGIEHVIKAALDEGIAKNALDVDTGTLALIILKGFEGILRAKPIQELRLLGSERAKEIAMGYVSLVMRISPRSGNAESFKR